MAISTWSCPHRFMLSRDCTIFSRERRLLLPSMLKVSLAWAPLFPSQCISPLLSLGTCFSTYRVHSSTEQMALRLAGLGSDYQLHRWCGGGIKPVNTRSRRPDDRPTYCYRELGRRKGEEENGIQDHKPAAEKIGINWETERENEPLIICCGLE